MDRTWTTRELLAWTTKHFEQRGIESARVAAEMLLSHVLGVERLRLYMEPERPASEDERGVFREMVARAGRHEPVDYLVGRSPFFSLELAVTPAVLIPRPSTETLVEHVLQYARTRPAGGGADTEGVGEGGVRVADVCTGSGAIAIAVCKHLPTATAVATDVSGEALDVARQNAAATGVAERIDFRQGDLYKPLGDERFDYLLANPPYISDAEWAEVAPNVRDHEPTLALRSGAEGLDHLRPLIAGAGAHLEPGGLACFEIAASQEPAVRGLAEAAGWDGVTVLKDHERLPRVVVGTVG